MSKSALGRGLDSLIPVGMDVADVANTGEHVKEVSIESVHPNPEQPRKEFDESALDELAHSIKQHGIIQPLVVTPAQDNSYRIIAGERRYRASKIAKLTKIPVIVRDHKELEELEIALVENVQRVDLSPLEQAISIVKLRDQFSLTPKQISAKLGKAETTISNLVRLLQLPKPAIDALKQQKISEGHARAILSLKDSPDLQEELLNNIIVQKWSVRDAENFVKKQRSYTKRTPKVLSKKVEQIYKLLPTKMQSRVRITERSNDRGTVTISYSDIEQLSKIIEDIK